ncbi:hypothetical protein WDZ92_22920, partial [Nostoc sp. NIES-2111]
FQAEHEAVYRDLAETAPLVAATAARRRVRVSDWYCRLAALEKSELTRFEFAKFIVSDIAFQPEHWDRFTLGWVRKQLL